MNPGPVTNTEKIDRLQNAIDSLIANSNQNQETNAMKLDQINNGIAALGARVTNLEKQVQEVASMKENLSTVKETVASVQHETLALREQVEALGDTIDDFENRMRRNNLIFKGLPEAENETWDVTERIVTHFVKDHLAIDLGTVERAHRLGRKRIGINRPIIVKFLSFKSKDEVLHNAFKLKNVVAPKVQISEDFSRKVQFARKKLWDFASQFRECNTRYKIRFDKLYANDSTYVYDHASGSVVSVRGPKENTMPQE